MPVRLPSRCRGAHAQRAKRGIAREDDSVEILHAVPRAEIRRELVDFRCIVEVGTRCVGAVEDAQIEEIGERCLELACGALLACSRFTCAILRASFFVKCYSKSQTVQGIKPSNRMRRSRGRRKEQSKESNQATDLRRRAEGQKRCAVSASRTRSTKSTKSRSGSTSHWSYSSIIRSRNPTPSGNTILTTRSEEIVSAQAASCRLH